jgi:hypothetical protein
MTINDLKKLDKQIRFIQYPFGRGFQTLKMTLNETAWRSARMEKKRIEKMETWLDLAIWESYIKDQWKIKIQNL